MLRKAADLSDKHTLRSFITDSSHGAKLGLRARSLTSNSLHAVGLRQPWAKHILFVGPMKRSSDGLVCDCRQELQWGAGGTIASHSWFGRHKVFIERCEYR